MTAVLYLAMLWLYCMLLMGYRSWPYCDETHMKQDVSKHDLLQAGVGACI